MVQLKISPNYFNFHVSQIIVRSTFVAKIDILEKFLVFFYR